MPNFIDLTGQRFGRLVCISRAPSKGGQSYWNCQCDCGNQKTIRMSHLRSGNTLSCGCYNKEKQLIKIPVGSKWGRLTVLVQSTEDPKKYLCLCECGQKCLVNGKDLRRGHTKSCGCLQKEQSAKNGQSCLIDLIGQRFGKLVVTERVTSSLNKHVRWICRCDCGETIEAEGYHLRRGSVRSCGCLQRADITGQRFGMLVAIDRNKEYSNKNKYGCSFWNCQCDCGKKTIVYLGHLTSGHTTSCGCDKASRGEQEIIQLLNSHSIKFLHDKQYFSDLYLPSGGIGRYDFIIFNEDDEVSCVIEFDGEQHYRDGWNSVESVLLNDEAKNQYAFKHDIPIIRIPYWERGNITMSTLFDGIYELKIAKVDAEAPDMEEAQEVASDG